VQSTDADAHQIARFAASQFFERLPPRGREMACGPMDVPRSKEMFGKRQNRPKARGCEEGMARPNPRILV